METYTPWIANLAALLDIARGQYHQLVFWLAEPQSSAHWREMATALGGRYVNLNLELSQALLEIPKRQWPHKAMGLTDAIASSSEVPVTLLDRIEILFDQTLRLDVLKSLQQVARRHCLLVVWPGERDDRYLTYAEPGHPEYCRYSHKDLLMFPTTP
jgi:hypothetical protein